MTATAPAGGVRRLPDGRYVVPGNRADLLAGYWPSPPPTVTVVIPYYREQHCLDLVLTGLAAQNYPLGRLEVIVADDGSPDPPNVAALGTDIAVSVVRQADRGFRAAAARNLGARAAAGELLCFLDGDTVPTPDYLRTLTRLPGLAPDAVVTGHRKHADLTGMTPDRLRGWLIGAAEPPPEIPEPRWLLDLHRDSRNLHSLDRHSYRAVISAVLGCPAALFAELGGFDETFTSYGGEDWEFGYRALNAGAVLAHEPAAVAWHDGADWGARPAEAAVAAAEKERETETLARLIPGIRPANFAGPYPADVIVWIIAHADVATTAAAAYRAGLDCVVVPDRARATGTHQDVPRCRVQVWVTGAGAAPTAAQLRELVDRVGPGRHVGRATVTSPDGWRALAVATPALRRTERWRHRLDSADLLSELFGSEELFSR